jgi:hypothetical protein
VSDSRFTKKEMLLLAACLLALLAIIMWGCSPVRVSPVGTISEDPTGGGWTMNRDLPQPVAADYQPGAMTGGFLQTIGAFLPSPWREIVLMLSTTLVAKRVAESPLKAALQQTVNGIELAKADNPAAMPAIHQRLAETQDERTKRLVWDLRP